MKIEKLSNNQIRCTLTREDLTERGLKLSELAYGTDKAKELFRDMMQQALYLYGFQAENTPLMIEAIPMNSGSIVLVVTKVDNPDELDSRFSSFAPGVQSDILDGDHTASPFEQLMSAIRGNADSPAASEDTSADTRETTRGAQRGLRPQDIKAYQSFLMTHRLYTFPSISAAAKAARQVAPAYTGESALYLDEETHIYYLFLAMRDAEEASAMQPCLAALSEYGGQSLSPYARLEFVREHGRTVLAENAITALSTL